MSGGLDDWLHAVRRGVAGAVAPHVLVLRTTGSTNDDVARAALEGAPEGYTVIAAGQTAGRGRRGASWHSPAGHGLYLSTLLRPDRWPAGRADGTSPAPALITLMAGVGVVQAITDVCDVPAELKWPNDVMVRVSSQQGPGSDHQRSAGPTVPTWIEERHEWVGPAVPAGPATGPAWRKLAGILAEGASDGGVLRTVVLGIGLNLSASPAPDDVARRMIALDTAGRAPLDGTRVEALVRALLVQLRAGCHQLSRGECARVRDEWRRRAPSVDGTAVRWHHQGVMQTGRSLGIDESGALRVRTSDDNEVTVHGGEVEWLLDEA